MNTINYVHLFQKHQANYQILFQLANKNGLVNVLPYFDLTTKTPYLVYVFESYEALKYFVDKKLDECELDYCYMPFDEGETFFRLELN